MRRRISNTAKRSALKSEAFGIPVREPRLHVDMTVMFDARVLMQGIDALVRVSEGDLRKAITLLQSTARLSAEKEITESIVLEIAGVSPPLHYKYLLIKWMV